MPAITVLIPVYNTARWLRQTIGSVQAQTFADWKLIAVDDGSTDDSPKILQEIAAQDSRIQIITRQNRGLIATRNELLHAAYTPLVAWLDSDDQMPPNRLALQLARFNAEPDLLCLGGAALITDPDGLPIRTDAFAADHDSLVAAMNNEIAFYFPTVTMKREAALRVGGFREPLAIAEDFDLCLRLSEIGRVANLPEIMVHYRQHLTSTANAGRAKTHIYSQLVRDLAYERRTQGSDRLQRGEPVHLHFENLPTAKQNAAETHARWAWWALHAHNLKTARKYARRVLRQRPFSPASWRLLACTLRGH